MHPSVRCIIGIVRTKGPPLQLLPLSWITRLRPPALGLGKMLAILPAKNIVRICHTTNLAAIFRVRSYQKSPTKIQIDLDLFLRTDDTHIKIVFAVKSFIFVLKSTLHL